MRAAPRDEFSKGNEWKIYDYVTRHFIGKIVKMYNSDNYLSFLQLPCTMTQSMSRGSY